MQFGIVPARMWLWPSSCCRPSPFSVVRPEVPPSRKPRACMSPAAQREVADALEAEHRVVDVERHHDPVVRRVRRRRRDPAAHAARLVDAFLQHLAGLVLAVVHHLVAVDSACTSALPGCRCRSGGTAPPCRRCAPRRPGSAPRAARAPCRAAAGSGSARYACVVEISRPSAVGSSTALKVSSGGTLNCSSARLRRFGR